ncbi:MAG: hypothetical protein P8Y65_03965 [Campylobacterales bacterium]|jgi:hypothetical protein
MKAFLIDPDTRTVTEQNYDGQPNSLYTLFKSLLVDNHAILRDHMVFSGSEAYEKGEKGFLLGEKLLFGKTLITGYAGFEETDAAIGADELKPLVRFEIPEFYAQVLALLPADFSFEERYEMQLEEGVEPVTAEWVIFAFNLADTATKTYFLNHLENTVTKGEDVHAYLKKMGELAIKSMNP